MKIRFRYGSSVTVLPTPSPEILSRATDVDLRVLIFLGGYATPHATPLPGSETIASELGVADAQVLASLSFWRGAGLIEPDPELPDPPVIKKKKPQAAPSSDEASAIETEEIVAEKPRVTVQKPKREDSIPMYTSEEMATLLESNPLTADMLQECQKLWGKIFNTHETNIILGLSDYLGLEWDYILTLIAHCVSVQKQNGEKRSLHYLEKMAFSYYDNGVTNMPALQEQIRKTEALAGTEGQLRVLFGMKDRSLTTYEKKVFSTWLYEFGFDMTIIRKAYEIAVDTKGEPRIRYINSLLENWNRDNLRTPEAIDASIAEFRKKHPYPAKDRPSRGARLPDPLPGGSFETDEFFDTAVNKTFADTTD